MPQASIKLLLQSSSGLLSLALAKGETFVFNSEDHPSLDGSRDVGALLSFGLKQSQLTIVHIEAIYVDRGPGALGATRTAVAFANALSFARSVPLYGVSAFELLGFELSEMKSAEKEGGRPLALVRRAARPQVFYGFYDEGALKCLSFLDEEKLPDLIAPFNGHLCLAGNLPIVAGDKVIEPVKNRASMRAFLAWTFGPGANCQAAPLNGLVPITETSLELT